MPPETITWTKFHEDGTIVNVVYLAPKDPEIVALVKSLLGPVIMDGMVHTEELRSAKARDALNIGTAIHYDIEEE